MNGEIGSANTGGVKDHVVMGEALGSGRCIVKSEIIISLIIYENYLFKINNYLF